MVEKSKPGVVGGIAASKREEIPPLEWQEETGTWSWPPKQNPQYKSTVATWEAMLRVLAEGPVEDPAGRATMVLAKQAGVDNYTTSNLVGRLLELEHLDLIKRSHVNPRTGIHSIRRTYRIELNIPVEQLPLHLQPAESPSLARLDEIQARQDAEADADFQRVMAGEPREEPTPIAAVPSGELTAHDVAMELLDLVYKKLDEEPITQQQVDDLIARLTKAEQLRQAALDEVKQLQSDNSKMLANQRELRIRLDAALEENRGLQANLDTAIRVAENGSLGERTRRTIESLRSRRQ